MPKRMWVLTGKCIKQTQRQFQIVDLPQCTLQGLIDILFDIALLWNYYHQLQNISIRLWQYQQKGDNFIQLYLNLFAHHL